MSKKAADRGKEMVLALASKAKTPELKAALTLLGADAEVLEMLGDGTLKQDEFSRLANDLKTKETEFNDLYARVQKHEAEINTFHTQNFRQVVLGAEIEKAGGLDKFLESHVGRVRGAGSTGEEEEGEQPRRAAAPAPVDTSKFLTLEQLDHRIAQERANMNAGMQSVTAITSKYALEHYQKYEKPLDVPALFDFCNKHRIPLDKGGYEAFTKDLADAASQKDLEKQLKEAEERGAKKALEQMQRGDGMPYLVGNGGEGTPVFTAEPSIRDILHARRAGKDATAAVAGEAASDVLAAVADYTAGAARARLGLNGN